MKKNGTSRRAKKFRVGFCVSGGGRLFRAAARQAAALGIEPALVVAEPSASPELESFCAGLKIPFVRLPQLPRAEFDAVLFQHCAGAKLDLLMLTFDRIVSARLIRHYAGRVVNVHPSLLPAFPGMRALDQTLARGVKFAGATLHVADEQLDHGPVVIQCVMGVRRDESAAGLGRRLFPWMRLMYLQVIAWYAEGRVTQDKRGHVVIRDAVYGELPISPAIEQGFPD